MSYYFGEVELHLICPVVKSLAMSRSGMVIGVLRVLAEEREPNLTPERGEVG